VIGLGVLGAVGLGAGSVLGLLASSKNADSKAHCLPDDENRCSERGVELRDDAFVLADVATVGFVVGGAALGTAVVLWLTGDDDETAGGARAGGLRAAPTATGLTVLGEF
jgi:hypothetical protein